MNKANGICKAGLAFLLWAIVTFQAVHAAGSPEWFRGQLHAHSYWSDGRAFPEQAIAAYKDRGYQFLCLTDHNRFADDTAQWRTVAAEEGDWPPDVTKEIFDAYVQAFGKDWVESKADGPVTSVRLKTYAEMKAKFEEPGKFLLMPGVEITQTLNGHAVHQNYVNLPVVLPSIKGAELVQKIEQPKPASELILSNIAEAKQAALEQKASYLFMLNHPFWVYYDVVAQDLIDCPKVHFFEVCNGGSEFAPNPQAVSYTPGKFWDSVNAFRSIRGDALLFGIASDDAHYYDAKRITGNGGAGDAWVMVRAKSLTPDHILAAMEQGDFYATTGVLLDEITFSRTDPALRVRVKAEQGVGYRIHFITTKRGFDQKVTHMNSPAEGDRPARTIPVYSEDIGRIVKTVSGTQAEYRLESDDLYVRAQVESDRPAKYSRYFHPAVETAWTQPCASK